MKKVLAILLAISVLALSACAAKQVNSDTQKDSNTAETEQKPGSEQTEQPAQEAKRVEPLVVEVARDVAERERLAVGRGAAPEPGREAAALAGDPHVVTARAAGGEVAELTGLGAVDGIDRRGTDHLREWAESL